MLSNTTTSQKYGRQLSTSGEYTACPNGPNEDITGVWGVPGDSKDSLFWPCNVLASSGASDHVSLANPSDVTRLQYGLTNSTVLSDHAHSSKNWFFYADPKAGGHLDFMASTPAISTQCMPMTKKCLSNSGAARTFECSPGLQRRLDKTLAMGHGKQSVPGSVGDASGYDTGIASASDVKLSSTPSLVNRTRGPQWSNIIPRNPAHFGTWAFNYPQFDSISEGLVSDPEIEYWGSGVLWFLNCTTTVANVTYAWVNGSMHTFEPVLASPEMAALFLGKYSLIGITPHFADFINRAMSNMATVASVSDSMTQLTNTWAREFSKNALALTIGAFAPLENSMEEHRNASFIVARVPLAPPYLLVATKLIYVVAVMALAIGAYAFTHPAETEVVKVQLSTKGLAAALFDQPGLVQENAVKAVQARLDIVHSKRSNTDPLSSKQHDQAEPKPGDLRRANTSPAEINGGKPKVGIVPNADGAWKFVVMADGAWHSISPIVKSFVENEARHGKLGELADVINAWK